MIRNTVKKLFDIRDGELRITFLMLTYIFLIIATLLIIKPTVNSLFVSELGADSLPFGYLLVAVSAVFSSYFYTRATEYFSLYYIIRFFLGFTIISLIFLGVFLHLGKMQGWVLYVFYVGVAIYAVLVTSQFWVLANLVFNVREAKRLFGFIGAGAITGGIFGGYLTTILAPLIGNENLVFLAALLILLCFPILKIIWHEKVGDLNSFKQRKRMPEKTEYPFKLIRNSKHLSYLAGIIGIGVITARLIDYQFSDIAVQKIPDSDELTSFFAFWLSTFNVISLLIQLFITRRIVGVWGVGFSLLLLPAAIFLGVLLFFVFPELWVVILLKAADGSLKQSINKSAVELLVLPLPFQLKNKTKSFIDVVVDSVATGIAGFLLIFFIKGLEVPTFYITALILLLSLVWGYFVMKARKEYFVSFRKNLDNLSSRVVKKTKQVSKESFLNGMINVFNNGTEREILFMLGKTQEINDKRFTDTITKLLHHPSNAVKAEALRNLYFLNDQSIVMEVQELLFIQDEEVVLAALEYLLLHAVKNEDVVFDAYLDHPNPYISGAALFCLAKETRGNNTLKKKYKLKKRLKEKALELEKLPEEEKLTSLKNLISMVGFADQKEGYSYIFDGLDHPDSGVRAAAIQAAGNTLNPIFIDKLLLLLENKKFRVEATSALTFYGKEMLNVLSDKVLNNEVSMEVSRLIPPVIAKFKNQEAIKMLLSMLIHAEDLTVRLECLRALTGLKKEAPALHFDKKQIAKTILEECQLYNKTLNAMHTQIIVYYLKQKKLKKAFYGKEMEARESLLELLERRLDAGLERIFKLLELQYTPRDVQMAYNGILSSEQEKRTQAIEFLDNLLNPNLKSILIPIIESSVLDTSSEEVIEMIRKNRHSEFECLQDILNGRDQKLKLAVLFLIEQKADPKYTRLIESLLTNDDPKIRSFAQKAYEALNPTT
ncbi:MAG: hypothetical protein KDC85_01980 [Saprospiraceae bacterium]|nr:hypothetical protein [Saprospiraceae bacterium]MCB9325698.1 hypothetical protein [Lewinellaceae bacterium]